MSAESYKPLVLANTETAPAKRSPLDWSISRATLGRLPVIKGYLEQRNIADLVNQLMNKMVKEALEIGYTVDFRDDTHGHVGRNLYFMTRDPRGLIHKVIIGAHRSRYTPDSPTPESLADYYNRDALSLRVGSKGENPIDLEVNKVDYLPVPKLGIKGRRDGSFHCWQKGQDEHWRQNNRTESIAALNRLLATVPDAKATQAGYVSFANWIAEDLGICAFSNLRWCTGHREDILTTLTI